MKITIEISDEQGMYHAKTTISEDLIRPEMRKGKDFETTGAGSPSKRDCLLDTLSMLQRSTKKGQIA